MLRHKRLEFLETLGAVDVKNNNSVSCCKCEISIRPANPPLANLFRIVAGVLEPAAGPGVFSWASTGWLSAATSGAGIGLDDRVAWENSPAHAGVCGCCFELYVHMETPCLGSVMMLQGDSRH